MMKVVKVSDHVHERLKQLADKKGLSINNMIEYLLEVYQGGGDRLDIKKIIEKQIVLKYDTRCRRCGRPLKSGELAYYTRYVYEDGSSSSFVLCLDCYYQSSEALGKFIVEREKIKQEIKSLKLYRNRLINEITNRLEVILKELEKLKLMLSQIPPGISYYDFIADKERRNLLSMVMDKIEFVSNLLAQYKAEKELEKETMKVEEKTILT